MKRSLVLLAIGVLLCAHGAVRAEEQASTPQFFGRDGSVPDVTFPLTYTCAGSETSQGDALIGADTARTTYGVSGAGVKIGIISDSFDALGGANLGVSSGDLPGPGNPLNPTPVNVLEDDGGTDEGRAVAEIVHDVAPGANLYFHQAFKDGTQAGMATAVDNLVAAGVNVIVDDVGFLNEPYFQDGVIAQAMNNARAAGVVCVSSAGNQARESYTGTYTHTNWDGFYAHDFDANGSEGGDPFLNILVGAGRTMRAVVQWTDPYPSVGAPDGHELLDLDAYLWDFDDLSGPIDSSLGWQEIGDDPWELVGIQNTSGSSKQYGLSIEYWSGPTERDLKVIVYGGDILDEDDTDSPTVVGHSAADGCAAIAAMWIEDTTSVEPYSSAGPTDIRFDENGDPMPELRDSLFLTAHDGVDTTFFGFDTDGDGTKEFFGTSASAPHVAAVVALMMERADDLGLSLTPDEILTILADTAVDIESPGYDDLSGYGLVDAYAAVGEAPEPATVGLIALGGVALLLRRRRRG